MAAPYFGYGAYGTSTTSQSGNRSAPERPLSTQTRRWPVDVCSWLVASHGPTATRQYFRLVKGWRALSPLSDQIAAARTSHE